MSVYFKPLILVFFAVMLLGACSNTTLKDESAAAVKAAASILKEEAKKPNKSGDHISFYLPFGFKVASDSPNNIILKNGSKTYILFVNPKEKNSSNVVYKASVKQYKKLVTNEKLPATNKFGYVLIAPIKENLNELTVGIGGTKMTTEAKPLRLTQEANTMMRIVNSVQYKK